MTLGTYQQVKDSLKKLGITDYTVINHPAAHTTEEADAYIAGHEGVRTKTMFLKGKKRISIWLLWMIKNQWTFINSWP